MPSTARAYHALTGDELQEVIVQEVRRACNNAGLSGPGVTYPLASWAWSLDIFQRDEEGKPLSETPVRHIAAANSPAAEQAKEDPKQKLLRALEGGSKRFAHHPPSPTEVREDAKLPLPEA